MSRTVAIVPAAGASSRMGAAKALLPWGEGTLLAYQVEQLRLAGADEVIVVAGCDADAVAEAASGAGATVVVNEQWREGRASSIRAGAAAIAGDADPVVVLNVDQPRPAAIIRVAIEAYRASADAAIVVPVYEGNRGHPTLFAGRLLAELRSVREEDEGLRAVLKRHAAEIREVVVDDATVRLDLNTPQEYETAWEALAAPGSVRHTPVS